MPEPRVSPTARYGVQQAPSLQINETLGCQLGSPPLQMTSASGSSARRQEDGAIDADKHKTPLLALTKDESEEVLCQEPSLLPPGAHSALSGLMLSCV